MFLVWLFIYCLVLIIGGVFVCLVAYGVWFCLVCMFVILFVCVWVFGLAFRFCEFSGGVGCA